MSTEFRTSASHVDNPRFEYLDVSDRMTDISVLIGGAENLPQAVTKIIEKYGIITLGQYDVFDMLVGDEGKYPLISFTMKDGMKGWLFLPEKEYGEGFVNQQIGILNSIYEKLLSNSNNVIPLEGGLSLSNQVFESFGDHAKSVTFSDRSKGFFLNPTH